MASVGHADLLVGRLVKSLEDLGIRDRTVVIFTTDNGTSKGVLGTIDGIKPSGGKSSKFEGGVSQPFIVNCPGMVPEGVEVDALNDFTDLLPTLADLGGAQLPNGVVLDGATIAPIIRGKTNESTRQWIMALGHGAGKLDADGICGTSPFVSRVLRDKRWKVWVNTKGKIEQLYDMTADPFERTNLLPLPQGASTEMNEAYEKGVMIQQIEFKPKDRGSEYSKMRVTINKKTHEIMRLKVFSRDGSRFTFSRDKASRDKDRRGASFVFGESKAAEVTDIEALRMG